MFSPAREVFSELGDGRRNPFTKQPVERSKSRQFIRMGTRATTCPVPRETKHRWSTHLRARMHFSSLDSQVEQ